MLKFIMFRSYIICRSNSLPNKRGRNVRILNLILFSLLKKNSCVTPRPCKIFYLLAFPNDSRSLNTMDSPQQAKSYVAELLYDDDIDLLDGSSTHHTQSTRWDS